MITLSHIMDYTYCPMRVYIRIDNSEIVPNSMIIGKLFREALFGFEEIIKRNLGCLKGELKLSEILKELFKDVPEYIRTIYQRYPDETNGDESLKFENLKEDLKFNSWLIALKTQKILNTGISGFEAVDMLFPPSFIEFKIVNSKFGITGIVDKIEIIDGVTIQ